MNITDIEYEGHELGSLVTAFVADGHRWVAREGRLWGPDGRSIPQVDSGYYNGPHDNDRPEAWLSSDTYSFAFPEVPWGQDEEGAVAAWLAVMLEPASRPTLLRLQGLRIWHCGGQLHRTDGPALEYPDGEKEWYLHGRRPHRDGPKPSESMDDILG